MGGDILPTLLVTTVAIMKNIQKLDASFSWVSWYNGYVDLAHPVATASWQGKCTVRMKHSTVQYIAALHDSCRC